MDENDRIDEKDAIRVDIVKLAAFIVLYVLSMLIASTGLATFFYGIYLCGIKWYILIWFALFSMFCVALIAFVVIYKKVFGKRSDLFQ
jgi:hypothetical protein